MIDHGVTNAVVVPLPGLGDQVTQLTESMMAILLEIMRADGASSHVLSTCCAALGDVVRQLEGNFAPFVDKTVSALVPLATVRTLGCSGTSSCPCMSE